MMDVNELADVMQDIWATVVREIENLRQRASFRSWLFKIAHNCKNSFLRKKMRDREVVGDSPPIPFGPPHEWWTLS
jgi:DNA-directed RNA polymerase specialized sigma24 family protein